ncbi:class I SAM-dependent methyltransferase [Alienimonas californiensis]|uniref:Ubiquinone/menaquinone biosynthesis C-methyltransferase UbiE n=1 Tax=Alienimonas californiensis TaxID=2527989 RepID=A0A517P627_9PLAN|nr:methyltransferase domain-containing protein [Alienimonas californiensis]QDT14822.1 Ubiquinone/menaquinone biosynthesis C-methyltransferase UbiE [Alienimonas californiensis]
MNRPLPRRRAATLFLLAVACAPGVGVSWAQEEVAPAPESVKPGINDRFLNEDLDAAEWAGRFEVESREAFAAREAVVAALKVEPGQTVADVGAGTGTHMELFAAAVGQGGRLFAVDLAPAFVARLRDRAAERGISQITPVLCSERSVMLPANSCDLVFNCDTYHHFEFPDRTLDSIRAALKPGGRLAVMDFERIPGVSSEWTLGHVRAGKATVRAEIEAAGLEFVAEPKVEGLSENYLIIFRKPLPAPDAAE